MNCVKAFLLAALDRYEDYKTIRFMEERSDMALKGVNLFPQVNNNAMYAIDSEEDKRTIVRECQQVIGTLKRKWGPKP